MDPHEKNSMDAEKIMLVSWDFEFMVKETLNKLARTTKFHVTPLGPEAGTVMEESVGHPTYFYAEKTPKGNPGLRGNEPRFS